MAEQLADEQPATTFSASRPSTLPLSNPFYYRAPPCNAYLSWLAGYEQHRKRMREISYFYQLQMLGNGPSNNPSPSPQQPKEDDLPVTHEMRQHYLQQLRERLTQDAIGLPS
uniref:Uncharacterized protein n=1 Tax=Panagrolaimus sp. PS1159 TaxID=55785 RepID=A0AC35GIH7_9BILA